MKTKIILALAVILISPLGLEALQRIKIRQEIPVGGAPPYGDDEPETVTFSPWEKLRKKWKRPEVPPKVGLQIGHLHSKELPEELKKLRNNGGASAGGYDEVEINKLIVERVAALLEDRGITVDILPATIPPNYWADIFLSIHADGSTNTTKSGFKIASPWQDLTGKSDNLVRILERTYQKSTGLTIDRNVTRNMRGYYAFSWWKYKHSIHPMTTAAIVETGFLTNWSNRQLLTKEPEKPARALAEGILSFLKTQNLVTELSL